LKQQGKSVIFISHKLKEVFAICDRVTVLKKGQAVGTVNISETNPDALAEMMVGREILSTFKRKDMKPGKTVLRVEGLSAFDNRKVSTVKNISFEVREFEILGLAGVEGNGQNELVETLVGVRKSESGKIYLDEKEIGSGSWKGELKPGNYKLRFGDINSYYTPEPTTIRVDEGKVTSFTYTYSPYFSIVFSPIGISPKKETGSIQLGWVNEDNEFHSDPNNAPEILIPEQLGKKAWVLGYAFAYRNPPENDAIVFSFNLPANIDLKNNIWLKMWGYRTDENYPMEFTSVNEIRIIVNNRMIQKDYTLRYSIDESGESQYERFRINNLLQPGKNTIQISTGPLNTTYFALWKIAVE